jgi:PKD repeat protein
MAAAFAGRPSAQAQSLDGPGFQLSRSADFASEDRDYTTLDTLHMWVACPVSKDSLAEQAATGWWRLEGPTQSFSGELEPVESGLLATLPLSAVSELAVVWTWSASVEWKGTVISSPIAAVRITLALPAASYQASAVDGEAPLEVQFEDRSAGAVTGWSWDFGDGCTAVEPSPAHVFSTPGTYAVTLTVTNPWGVDGDQGEPITVREQDLAILYGMNASENVWWQRGIAFSDGMARAGEFCRVVNGAITPDLAPLIPLGEEPPRLGAGWPDLSALEPGQQAGARLFGSMGGSLPDGRELPYVLTWEGTGSCRLAGQAVVGEANRTSRRVEVFLDPEAGGGDALLIWVVDSSDPDDPVRDAHLWLPGMEADAPILWPPFVARLRAMNGGRGPVAWRAMDWNQVNQYGRADGSAPFVFDLAGRITPASPSQGTKRGVCPEFQVALCNAIGADLFFNVPHAANGLPDEDYETFLRDAFTRIRDGSPAVPGVNGGQPFAPLAPSLRVTVEFSNEVWNPDFPVNTWLKARALQAGRTLRQQAAIEIRRVFAVAEDVFSGVHAPRLRRFVGGWLGDPDFLQEVLDELGPEVQVDAAGPACYFAPRPEDVDAWMADADPGDCPNCPTSAEVIESARLRIAVLDQKLLEHQPVVASHVNPDGSAPRFELYEGGASFSAGYQPWGPAASQAQRLPEMYDAYVADFVPTLIARGVQAVMWYSFVTSAAQGSSGPYGHWESMDQAITLPVPETYVDEGAPKAAAVYRLPPRRAQ